MVYAVDFVLNVMRKLSSSEPVLFQRDGSLYLASGEGFGQVTYGLSTTPETIQSWERRKQLPEILESEDVICKGVEDEYSKKPAFKEGEAPFLRAIAFGSDTNKFTLEEITKAAKELAALPDDIRKVRMISHESGYHSHKYGYASDGIDVWVQEARVMDRNRYLGLVREREDALIQAMKQAGKTRDRGDMDGIYRDLKIPDCAIVTQYLKVSLPRSGRLHLHRDEPDSWTETTRMGSNYSGSTKGSILYHLDVNTSEESPFVINVTLNARELLDANGERLKSSGDRLVAKVSEQLSAVTSSMHIAQGFIDRMNAAHNKACAQNIEWRKSLRAKRTA